MDLKSRRELAAIEEAHGESIISLSFYGFPDGHISMWQHTNHSANYAESKQLLIAMRDHLDRFIGDGGMCPYNPEFSQLYPKE